MYTALVGPGHSTQRLKAVWEGLLSQATLVGGAEKRSSFSSRRVGGPVYAWEDGYQPGPNQAEPGLCEYDRGHI